MRSPAARGALLLCALSWHVAAPAADVFSREGVIQVVAGRFRLRQDPVEPV